MARAGEFGLPAVDLPPVDFSLVRARIRAVIETIQHHDSEERFQGLGVDVHCGEPVFMDDHTVDLDGTRISARFWVIATGSSASAPPIEGLAQTPHLTNREIFQLDKLPETLIVLGAGPIAIEMAQAFQRLGSRVTVIQRSGQILSREDADLAGTALERLRAEGVDVRLDTATLKVGGTNGRVEVRVQAKNGPEKVLTAEALLVALGRKPNLDGLNLEAAGVDYNRKGLELDDRLRTSVRHIFGAGDVTGRFQFTHAAGYEGGIVLSNAVFHLPRKADYTLMPWCTYCEPELASVGMNEKAARAADIEYDVWAEDFVDNDRAQAEGEVAGRIKMILDSREKPLGVQILGPGAGDLIAQWVTALSGKVKLATLAGAVQPYPTLAEINKRVAGDLMATKIFSERVRKGLRLFFGLRGRACGPDSCAGPE